ncbi:MAG: methionine--tRNA ligase [Patescibacteria group bacterium]
MAKKIFIGVAWPYVSGDIHIGHLAGYLLPADIFARFHRYIGNDVLMVSGSDCFGTPITVEADKQNTTPEEIVKKYHPKNVELFKKLGISFDLYTKTDTENHKKVVQDFFIKALEREYIFKKKTDQYYSGSEKRFLPDRYVVGTCPRCGYEDARGDQCDNCGSVLHPGELKDAKGNLTGKPVTLKQTEHYFFNWPQLQKFLEKYISKQKKWRPWVMNETKGWLEKGLNARAITRDLDWGVEIPTDRIPEGMRIEGAENKRIYVWFEAVIGYLSASIEWSGKNNKDWKDFWYNEKVEHAYFMGKDNLVFHTLFWPGELHAYDEKIHLPDSLIINQFLNLEGNKFSRSRGITIDSNYIVDAYGLDPVRFYLTLINPENADANFSWADFVGKTNDLLISNLGNFINRTLTLAKGLKFDKGKPDSKLEQEVSEIIAMSKKHLESAEFRKYVESILSLSQLGNKYLSEKEPWFLKEKNAIKFKEIMSNSIFMVLGLLLLVKPLMPESAEKIEKMIGVEIGSWPKKETDYLIKLISEVRVGEVKHLFNKLEDEVIEKERSKIKK